MAVLMTAQIPISRRRSRLRLKPAFPEGGPMPSITFDELNDVVKS